MLSYGGMRHTDKTDYVEVVFFNITVGVPLGNWGKLEHFSSTTNFSKKKLSIYLAYKQKNVQKLFEQTTHTQTRERERERLLLVYIIFLCPTM